MSADARSRSLPYTIAFLVVVGMAGLLGRELGGGEIAQYDGYATLNRSLGFLLTGDWLSITSNYEPVYTKPPLQYLLTAALVASGADTMLALRFWPFFYVVGTVVLTGVLGFIVAPRSAWAVPVSVMLVSSSSLLWFNSRVALLDAGNAFFVLATVCAVLLAERDARWWIAAGVAAGLCFLQKTPVALVAAALLVLALSRFGSNDAFRWTALRREPSFRIGAWTAIGLCLFWPVVQLVRHGAWFLVIFFGEQWFQRFAPVNPIDGASVFDPLRWVGWLMDDAPFTWLVCGVATVLALPLPRLRSQPKLRALALLVAIFCVALSIAGGSLYPRYLLVLMPILAVICAVSACELLPRPWVALVVATLLLGSRLPALAEIRVDLLGKDRSEMRLVAERFRGHLRADETPVFIRPDNDLGFSTDAFVYYADVGRTALIVRHDKWWQFAQKAEQSALEPPYSGVIHDDHYAGAEARLGPLDVLERVGPYVIWRQREPSPIREP